MTALWEFRTYHFKTQNGEADYIIIADTINKVSSRLITLVITRKRNDSLIMLFNPEPLSFTPQ